MSEDGRVPDHSRPISRGATKPAAILLAFTLAALTGLPGTFQRSQERWNVARAGENADPGSVSFSRDVAPILVNRCQGCHGPDKSKGEYRLDTFDRLMAHGESGLPPVTPGGPEQSALYRLLVTPDEEDRMPKKGEPLAPAEVELVKRWIEQGAAFDGADRSASVAAGLPHPAAPTAYARPVPVVALAFSPDGNTLAAGGYHEVTLWDAKTGQIKSRLGNLPQRIQAIDFAPNGSKLVVAGGTPGASGEVRLIDPGGAAPPIVLERIGDLMLAARFSPDGARVAAGGADNVVRVYEAASGKLVHAVEQHADWVTAVAFSRDGRWLASASRDKSVRVIDAATGEARSAFLDHTEPVAGVAWSADGETCFSAGRDRRLHAWDPDDGENLNQRKDGAGWETPNLSSDALRVTSAGDAILVACADGVVRSYRRQEAGKASVTSAEFPAFADWATALAVHPASGLAAAGSHAGEVRVWMVADQKEVARFLAAPGNAPPPPPPPS